MSKLKDKIFNIKMKKQRTKKGYCDLDVWNIDLFIENKLLAILKEFKKNTISYPLDLTKEEWDKILDRMIYLLTEMNEQTCSVQFDGTEESLVKQNELREKSKNEFYDLLKKWHFELWW